MTHESVPPADSPREVLAAVRDLTRQVRIAQRGTWFPLLVFAAITVLAIPLYRYAPHVVGPCRSDPQGIYVCRGYTPAVWIYWPIALILAYVAIAGFYVRRSRERGVGTPIRPYVIVGIVVAVLLAVASLWRALHPLALSSGTTTHLALPGHEFLFGLATPATAIGVALLMLAWVERTWALLAFSVVYLVIVLVQANQVIHASSPWAFLPQLLVPAALLALGGAAFALLRPTIEVQP